MNHLDEPERGRNHAQTSSRSRQRSVLRGGSGQRGAPDRLVVGGLYRYVRNPMYVAVLAAIVGQGLLLGQLGLLLYAAALWLIVAVFVRWYEEPTLTRRFGADYEVYRRAVPAWWPRLRPWEPGERDDPGAG